MNFKKYLPHILTIAGFIVLTVAYFSPLLSGKELNQLDTGNWLGAAKEILDFREQAGQEALWTNSMFSGMPAYQISVIYSNNLIQYVDKVLTLGLPAPSQYVFMYMIGFYFLLIVLGINQRVAIIGAIAFAFSSYFFISIATGHNTKAHAIAYMAPVMAGIILAYRGKLLAGGVITSVALALELYANHLQITYYLLLLVVLYVITELVEAIRKKEIAAYIKSSFVLIAAAILAIAPNISNIWATQEYGKESTRGPSELTIHKDIQTTGLDKDYITQWSYGVGESWTFLVPNFKGGVSDRIGGVDKDAVKNVDQNYKQYIANRFTSYYGDQPFTMGPVYAGVVVCLLFLIGTFLVKGQLKWWLLSATVLSFFLSWGKHFMTFTDFFLDYVPGYDKFRAVAMTLVIAQFTMPLLGAIFLDKIISGEATFINENKNKLKWIIGTLLGISLLFIITPSTFTSFSNQQDYETVAQDVKSQGGNQEVINSIISNLEIARMEIFVSDATRTFIFLLIASLLVFAFVKYKFKPNYLVYGLLFLTLVDLWSVNKRYLNSESFKSKRATENPFPMTAADQYILQDTSSYRVLNLAVNTFNDASTSYYHQSIGGYHGAKLKRYKELIDSSITPELMNIRQASGGGDSAFLRALSSQPSLNMLNTKYIIYNAETAPILNQKALGNVWFTKEVKLVSSADMEIAAVRNFDPAVTAIVDERFKEQLSGFTYQYDSLAGIRLTSYKPNHLTYEFNSTASQLAVFSEIYYDKGWNAYIDGKESSYFRCNYVLRGMILPAGKHTVEFKFEPDVITIGGKISLGGSVVLLGLLALLIFKEVKKLNA